MGHRDQGQFRSIAHYKMPPGRAQKELERLEAGAIARSGAALRGLARLAASTARWAVAHMRARTQFTTKNKGRAKPAKGQR